MSYTLYCRLIPITSGIVGHGFQETTNRLLVTWCNAPVLFDEAVLYFTQIMLSHCRVYAGQDVWDIKSQLKRHLAQVGRGCVTRPSLVIRLRPFSDAERLCKIALRFAASLPFFLQPGPYLFGKVQNNSSLIFTNALKCIIVHLTPHEFARNCTMPNSTISEQARQQAREALEKRGQSAKDFAELHNLNPSTVYAVLSGQSRCRRGEAHRAAVLLGIKDGVIEQ